MVSELKYTYSRYALWFTALLALGSSYLLLWKNQADAPVNFIVGDAEFYYYYLQSTFIDHQLITFDWLKPGSINTISHHPMGVSLLLVPFFTLAFLVAQVFHYPLDGTSLPFQMSISIASIFYALVGLIYLGKLFRLNNIPDKIAALVLMLIFFGTTLFHYTIIESAMSHVYSFCLISAFLYYSSKFVLQSFRSDLIAAALALGLILITRANNGLVVITIFVWFRNKTQCVDFFKALFKNRSFYFSILIVLSLIFFQFITWYFKEDSLFVNRYAPYGFYWLHPQLLNLLFGFEAGFFIYTPLCFLFLFGWIALFKENKYMFYATFIFISILVYFFASYSAYTYFDGLGIRVLVDYYALFALIGAKLFTQIFAVKWMYYPVLSAALCCVFINLVYSYQSSRGILLRSGMTFQQWKYVFLRTGDTYKDCLGGAHDYPPYAKQRPDAILSNTVDLKDAFDYTNKDYGVVTYFDSLGFNSNRIHLKIICDIKEVEANSSHEAFICVALEDKYKKESKAYFQFRLNETPAQECCETKHYEYTANMSADFKENNRLAVFIWNIKKQAFQISQFSVQVFNYNYLIKQQ